MSGIYKIINKIDGKCYIGSSNDIIGPFGRWYNHKQMLKNNKHSNIHLQRAWNKYGENNFDFIIVEEIPEDKLLIVEQKYLDMVDKEKCYNLTYIAGRIEMTNEIINKISIKAKQRLSNKENHPMFGRHHTKETIELIRRRSPKYGKENGMYGIHRVGKDAPGYGKGDNIIGHKNPRFNKTIHSFYNKITNECFSGTKYDFQKKFNITTANDLIYKRIKSTKNGWTITS